MNAITEITAAPAQPLKSVEADAHLFRSRVIDKFAALERWALGRLRTAGPDAKIPHLLGHKLDELRKLAKDQPTLFKKASVVEKLLERTHPHLKLRSTIAHSTIRCTGEAIFFEHVEMEGPAGMVSRLVIFRGELEPVFKDLCEIVNGFSQQTPA